MSHGGEKPLAVFDIDGTIIRSSLVIELTNELIDRGFFPGSARAEFQAEHSKWLNRHGDYEEYLSKLVGTYERFVTGSKVEDIAGVAKDVANSQTYQTYKYTRELIAELRKTHFLLAISGSPIEVVGPFAKAHGFDLVHGTVKASKNGVFTKESVIGNINKDKTLRRCVDEYNLTLSASVGVGDTESDIAFLEIVERPIAFNPNSKLFEKAFRSGWEVVVERKDVVYKLSKNSGKEYTLL